MHGVELSKVVRKLTGILDRRREELKKNGKLLKRGQENGGDDGARTRDLRRDRPAL
jgi:hypothetical protein